MARLALTVLALSALVVAGLAGAAGTADVFTYRTALTAAAEVPKPVAPAGARGVFTSTVTNDAGAYSFTWKLTFQRLSGRAVAAHIHRGRAGKAGAVLLALCGPCRSGQTGKMTIKKSIADALRTGAAYVNVHTAKNSAGEIRGQARQTGTGGSTPPPPPPPSDTPPPPPPPPPPDY